MSAIEQEIRYLLYHLQQQTLPHGGLSHHQELFALQWDGFEAALNRLVFELMQRHHTDQINWPGKGRDDLLYGFCPDT